jgi:hypothetical protein
MGGIWLLGVFNDQITPVVNAIGAIIDNRAFPWTLLIVSNFIWLVWLGKEKEPLEDLSRGVYRRDVLVFGSQKGRGVGRVESKRRLPFGFGTRTF